MKKKFIRLVLAKEDTDLIAWKNSLPPRSFTETVNKILVSESGGRIAPVLYEFSSSEVAEEVRAGFYVGDENVLTLLNEINKGDRTALPSTLNRLWFGSRAVLPLVSPSPRTVTARFLCRTMCSTAQGCCGKMRASLFGNPPRSPARPAILPISLSSSRKRSER